MFPPQTQDYSLSTQPTLHSTPFPSSLALHPSPFSFQIQSAFKQTDVSKSAFPNKMSDTDCNDLIVVKPKLLSLNTIVTPNPIFQQASEQSRSHEEESLSSCYSSHFRLREDQQSGNLELDCSKN
jgi:hypothetical protein